MASTKTLRLLLVEDNLEDEHLVREALLEIEENALWGKWHNCDLTHVEDLAEAAHCLMNAAFDAVLLNLSLPDAPNLLDAFVQARTAAEGTAVIVLADENDPALASLLLREGAQDVFIKADLDCRPFARAILNSIERERRLGQLSTRVYLDPLTGGYNRAGFLQLSRHYLRLARRSASPAVLMHLNLTGAPSEEQDLLLIRAAEVARVLFPDTTLLGRPHQSALALLAIGQEENGARLILGRLLDDLQSAFPASHRPSTATLACDCANPNSVEELLADVRLRPHLQICCQVEDCA